MYFVISVLTLMKAEMDLILVLLINHYLDQ